MPLKLSRRSATGPWWVSGTVAGQRIRESTGTTDRRLADEYRADREAQAFRGAIYGKKAVATWGMAVDGYAAEIPMTKYAAAQLLRITDHLGDKKLLKDIDQAVVNGVIRAVCKAGTAPATVLRHVIGPMRAVMRHAALLGLCDPPVFKPPKDPRGKLDQSRTRWLRPEEYRRLLDGAGASLKPLIVFFACIGARLSEALTLDWKDVDLRGRRLILRDTKNGRDRLVEDLPPAALAALANLTYPRKVEVAPGRYRKEWTAERTGRVFRTRDGKPYGDSEREQTGQIKTAWAGAVRRAKLPGEWKVGAKGHRWWVPLDVTPHVLRHTWATWHHAVHRDLLKLREEGDWSDVSLVARYAKACPAYLVPEIREAWGEAPDTSLAQSGREHAAQG